MREFCFRWSKKLLICAAAFLVLFGSGCGSSQNKGKSTVRIGVGLYRSDDTFINNLRRELEQYAKEYEKESGRKIVLDIQAAKGNQSVQNRQVERFVSLDCDVLCVNPVDRMAVSSIIDKAMAADIPLVFFNRQPSTEDMNRWDRLCYIGVDAKETAVLQGKIVADHYREHPEHLDPNGDGVVSYVLLEGETSHQDSLIRTEWSVKTILDEGVPLERLTGGIGNWERSQASALMEQWLGQYGKKIELVLSNNDDMALGALDAMERAGITGISVVGIDATDPGLAAVREGKMIGTVSADKAGYAKTIFDTALELSEKGSTSKEKYYWCRQEILTGVEN